MLDEVGSNHSDLYALLRALLERTAEIDGTLRSDPHAAVRDITKLMLLFLTKLSEYMADGSPSRVTHGAALVSLVLAFEDRDRGIVNPVLLPKAEDRRKGNNLRQEVMFARVQSALASELLFRAGRGKEEADKEVAELLGKDHRLFTGHSGETWRIVKRWRENIDSGDYPDAAEKFDYLLEAVLDTIRARAASGEPSADDLEKAADAALGELDRYT
jgi:hypothetical protein